MHLSYYNDTYAFPNPEYEAQNFSRTEARVSRAIAKVGFQNDNFNIDGSHCEMIFAVINSQFAVIGL